MDTNKHSSQQDGHRQHTFIPTSLSLHCSFHPLLITHFSVSFPSALKVNECSCAKFTSEVSQGFTFTLPKNSVKTMHCNNGLNVKYYFFFLSFLFFFFLSFFYIFFTSLPGRKQPHLEFPFPWLVGFGHKHTIANILFISFKKTYKLVNMWYLF